MLTVILPLAGFFDSLVDWNYLLAFGILFVSCQAFRYPTDFPRLQAAVVAQCCFLSKIGKLHDSLFHSIHKESRSSATCLMPGLLSY